jgi:hypothetical protein
MNDGMILRKTWKREEIENGFDLLTHHLRFTCTLSRELVGGLPATKEGIEAFVKYQAQILTPINPEEQHQMAERIFKEELGERRVAIREIADNLVIGEQQVPPPEGGELQEKIVGQVNVVRKDENGVWIGDWMVKAALKQTASRLGLWMKNKGLKGDMSEGARVLSVGKSLLIPETPHRIYLRNENGDGPAKTFWQTFQGRITTANGAVSIVTHAECVEPGATFEFEYLFLGGRMSEDEISKLVYLVGNTGLGSSRAMERGKFRVDEVSYIVPKPKEKITEELADTTKKKDKAA